MALRAPEAFSRAAAKNPQSALDYELAGEMATSLGRAGERVEQALAVLRALDAAHDPDARERALRTAARAAHHYLIQREMIGLRRHDDAIRHFGISPEVLARMGAG